jgi:hypothetical protein
MGVVTAFALLALGFASFIVGAPTATIGCGIDCPCQRESQPPPPFGFCQTEDDSPCHCPNGAALCPGFCLVDGGQPFQCDAGAEE